jgi:uncharacterized protein (TIGR02246 family)
VASDEQAIRDVMARWREHAAKGDVETLLSMLTDDVVFLTPGNAPFGRKEFEAGFRQVSSRAAIATHQDVKEVRVSGDLGYARSHLRVTVTPKDGSRAVVTEGDVLSVFRKDGGSWRIARDANLMPQAGRPDKV